MNAPAAVRADEAFSKNAAVLLEETSIGIQLKGPSSAEEEGRVRSLQQIEPSRGRDGRRRQVQASLVDEQGVPHLKVVVSSRGGCGLDEDLPLDALRVPVWTQGDEDVFEGLGPEQTPGAHRVYALEGFRRRGAHRWLLQSPRLSDELCPVAHTDDLSTEGHHPVARPRATQQATGVAEIVQDAAPESPARIDDRRSSPVASARKGRDGQGRSMEEVGLVDPRRNASLVQEEHALVKGHRRRDVGTELNRISTSDPELPGVILAVEDGVAHEAYARLVLWKVRGGRHAQLHPGRGPRREVQVPQLAFAAGKHQGPVLGVARQIRRRRQIQTQNRLGADVLEQPRFA